MAGVKFDVGANVQPALTPLKELQTQLEKLNEAKKAASDPTELNKFNASIVSLKNQIHDANASANAFATSTFGVSRATRLAHTDLEDMSRSLALFASGNERGVDALGNLAFALERTAGTTGGFKNAISAIGDVLASPVGIIVGVGAVLPLLSKLAEGFIDVATGASKAQDEIEQFQKSLNNAKAEILGFGKEADQALITRKLNIDLSLPPGKERTIAEMEADLDTANSKAQGLTTAIKEYNKQLDELQNKTSALQKVQDQLHFGSIDFSRNKVTLEKNAKEIELLKGQIHDLNQELKTIGDEQINIPLKIQVLKNDQAFEDAKKKAKADIAKDPGDLTPAIFAPPIRPQVGSLIKSNEPTFKDFVDDLNKKLPPVEIPIAVKTQQNVQAFKDIQKNVQDLEKSIASDLTPAIENMFQAFEQGKNPVKAFFDTIVKSIEQMIAKLIAAKIAEAAVSFLNPSSAIGGILGLGHGAGFGAAFGAIGFADGGIVTRPTLGLIGEAHKTEVVMPLDRLSGMLSGKGASNVSVSGVLVADGNQLKAVLDRTNRSNNRAF